MSTCSKIEWTHASWNPVSGCSKFSAGCMHCYAERMARRLQAMGMPKYAHGFAVTLHPELLELPLRWRKPRRVFVNSMSDLYHPKVPLEFIQQVFATMGKAHWHRFQILSKRAERLAELSPLLDWHPHVWQGVTVEAAQYRHRIDLLRSCGAAGKFISLEPMLDFIPELDLAGIDWVIVGGESGPQARPMQREWVLRVRDICAEQGVAFFFKQWGGVDRKASGRELDGKVYDANPVMTPLFAIK
jgi:protein gp37